MREVLKSVKHTADARLQLYRGERVIEKKVAPPVAPPPRETFLGSCHKCGKAGHRARDCSEPPPPPPPAAAPRPKPYRGGVREPYRGGVQVSSSVNASSSGGPGSSWSPSYGWTTCP